MALLGGGAVLRGCDFSTPGFSAGSLPFFAGCEGAESISCSLVEGVVITLSPEVTQSMSDEIGTSRITLVVGSDS